MYITLLWIGMILTFGGALYAQIRLMLCMLDDRPSECAILWLMLVFSLALISATIAINLFMP